MKNKIEDIINSYLYLAREKSIDMGLEDSIATYAFSEDYNEDLIEFDKKNNKYKFSEEAIEGIKELLNENSKDVDLTKVRLDVKEVEYSQNEQYLYNDDFEDEEIYHSYSSEHTKLNIFYKKGEQEDLKFSVDINISYDSDTGDYVIETKANEEDLQLKEQIKEKLSNTGEKSIPKFIISR